MFAICLEIAYMISIDELRGCYNDGKQSMTIIIMMGMMMSWMMMMMTIVKAKSTNIHVLS